MPWLNFAQIEPRDLKAVYAFLRTRQPIYHPVDSHPFGELSVSMGTRGADGARQCGGMGYLEVGNPLRSSVVRKSGSGKVLTSLFRSDHAPLGERGGKPIPVENSLLSNNQAPETPGEGSW